MGKVKISDIYFFQEGPGVRKWQFTESGVKLLNVGNINGGEINLDKTSIYISEEEAYGKYKHFLVDEGDLLIACSGIVVDNFHNKIAFIEKQHLPVCLNTSTMRFKELPEKKGTLDYLKYFLQTIEFKEQLRKLITGSAQLNFGPSHIRKIDMPLPSLATQKTIAAKLDKAQEIISYNKQLVEKYDQLTESLFIDMFGDPTSGKMKYAETELINLVANKFDIKCGPFGTQLSKSEYVLNGVPVWGIPQINSNFIKKPTEYVTISKAKYLEQYSVVPNDIVMSRKGNVGRCAIYPGWENGILHSDVLRIRCDETKISPIFLVWQFRISRSLALQVSDVSHGAIMPGINVTKLKQIKPFVPPIQLQNQFADRVEKIETQKQLAQETLAKSEHLFQSLLKESFK